MELILRRPALTSLLCLLASVTGCGGDIMEERRQRPPLREVFPPPSVEAQPPAAPATPPAPAAADTAAGAIATPAATEPDAGAETSAPEAAPEPRAQAEPPATPTVRSLEPEPADAEERTLPEARQPSELEREFEPTLPREPASAPPPSAESTVPSPAPPAAEQPAPLRIIMSTRPAVLVSIDGEPTYGPVEGTKLQRVLNTPAFLVKGVSGNYYLSVYDGFMRATKLAGPWTALPTPPRVVQEAKARALVDGEADLLAGRPDASSGQRPRLKDGVPRVIVSTRPATLVAIRGEPVYEPVEGTQLSRVVNTDARLFVHRPEDRTYLRLGERWYRAASLKGPWEAVDADALPPGLNRLDADG